VSSRDPEVARVDGAGEQQARPTDDVRSGSASTTSRRAPARASSRRTRSGDAAAAATAAARPVTLEVLNQRIEALTAAVERLTPPQLVGVAQATQLGELTAAVKRMAVHQPLVDLRAAAEHLGVSTRTLRRMVEREEVPFRRIGRTLRFNVALLAPRL
jgi:excisionase family DNA binding protein